MKTRVVVWSAVGVIVVAMVLVMLLAWKPEGRRPVAATDDVQREVARATKVVDKLASDVVSLRANPAAAPLNDSLAQAERLLNSARQHIAALQGVTDPRLANEDLQKVRAVIDTARGVVNRVDRKLKPGS